MTIVEDLWHGWTDRYVASEVAVSLFQTTSGLTVE